MIQYTQTTIEDANEQDQFEFLRNITMQQAKKTVLEIAASTLSRRSCTEMELRKKLYCKTEYSEQEIENAIDTLKEQGYLSDRRFAEDFVRVMRDRSYGDRRILERLLFKGVDKDLAKEVLLSSKTERDPFDDAMALIERRARRLDSVTDPQKLAHRIMCMLAGRGFPPEVTYRVLTAWSKRKKPEE